MIKQQRKPLSAREVALQVLIGVEEHQSYSNLLLNQVLKKHPLERADAGLATELVYGTIQRLNTLDYYLSRFVAKGTHKLQPWVLCLLRLSLYQLIYLERIPEHAIVNEAVTLAKKRGHEGISGMVNGVLRSAIRQKASLHVPEDLPQAERIALQHAHPEWLVRRWIYQLGAEAAESICKANNEPPKVSVRVNTLKHSREAMLEIMRSSGIDAEASVLAPDGIIVRGAGNVAHTTWFEQGDISIQDESSMLVAELLDPNPGMQILDCCAAPGGKSAHLAEKMKDSGRITACDLYEHKQKLIEEQAHRLGLSSIQTCVADARHLSDTFPTASFDRILLDAPCSGFGVIRRKPDLKWAKEEKEIAAIARMQYEIISSVQRLLKPGGLLIYSTCTIEADENVRLVRRFLEAYPDFHTEPFESERLPVSLQEQLRTGMLQLLPNQFHSDGFFICRLRKA
jgi:16S rRNA (cytosine967-C5)-methyltransferase